MTVLSETPSARLTLPDPATPRVRKVLLASRQERAQREWEFGQLGLPACRPALALSQEGSQPALWLTYIPGQTWQARRAGQALPWPEVLTLAHQAAQAIATLHEAGIAHGALTPAHLLLHADGDRIVCISLGRAWRPATPHSLAENPLAGLRPEEFAYLAPEQTGRTNQVPSFGVDLYALGVILYETLAGAPPFVSADPLELIHAHLAKTPVPLGVLVPDLPPVLAAIVHTLLNKSPQARYASASALLADLETCLQQWQHHGRLDLRIMPHHQLQQAITREHRLVGRNLEIKRLLDALGRTRHGAGEWVWIEGLSGSGKSSLAHSLRQPVVETGGFYLEGKFDQARRSTPFHALAQVIRQWVANLLTQDEAELDQWRRHITDQLGPAAQVIAEIVPDLEWITGPLTPPPPLEGSEAHNRIRYALGQWIQLLAGKTQQLVLMLDDIQWADPDTASILEGLAADLRPAHVMVIVTQRMEEPEVPSYVQHIQAQLRQGQAAFTHLHLGALEQEHLHGLLHDVLGTSVKDESGLVTRLYEKTGGNALHIRQLLQNWLQHRALGFDPLEGIWVWKPATLDQASMAGGIPALIDHQLRQLPEPTRHLLATAAVIGTRFASPLLEPLLKASRQTVRQLLDTVIREGLVAAAPESQEMGPVFGFVHGNIRDAALRLLDAAAQQALHFRLGQILLAQHESENLDRHLFDIVYHLNRSATLPEATSLRETLIALNLKASERAREAGAFDSAYELAQSGIGQLIPADWETQYAVALGLYQAGARLAALIGRYEDLARYTQAVLEHARSPLDQEGVVMANIRAYVAQSDMEASIRTGLEYLQQFGIRFPAKPTQLHVLAGLIGTRLRLRGQGTRRITALPTNTHQTMLAVTRLITETSVAAYFAAPDLLPLLIFKTLNINLRYGNSPFSAFAYDGYGFILAGALGKYDEALAFGKLAIRLSDGPEHTARQLNRRFIHNVFIRHWKEPIREIIHEMDRLFGEFQRAGNFENAAYSAQTYLYFALYQGMTLQPLAERAETFSQAVSLMNQPITQQRIAMYHQLILNLQGKTEAPLQLTGEAYREEEMLPRHQADNLPLVLHNFYFIKAFLAYLFGDYEAAAEQAARARPYEGSIFASYFVPLFAWLESLCLLALPGSARHRRRLRQHRKQLRRCAQHAPDNYLALYQLVLAEQARVEGKATAARQGYEEAVNQARQTTSLLVEALAWERQGLFLQTQDRPIQAATCLQQAYLCYQRWGAIAKTRQLQAAYGLTALETTAERGNLVTAEAIDLLSLVRILQTISTEIELPRLLDKIMAVMVEHAGAERGLILINRASDWEILAERDVNSRKVNLLRHQTLGRPDDEAEATLVPEGLIQYVIRSQEKVVINDVAQDPVFGGLAYMQQRKPLSLLSMPLIKQNKLVGVLYLENTLTTGAFTRRIQDGLEMLGSQLAISLENALLYEDLEDKVVQNKRLLGDLQTKVEEQEKTLRVFARFVPEPVIKKTLEAPELSVLEGELREVAVLFCDIRNFTPLSERLLPREVVQLLNRYYSCLTDIVQRHNGTVNQFVGDEVFATFGAPVAGVRNEADAVLCALDMIAAIEGLNGEVEARFGHRLIVGIGINSGPVVAGTMGSHVRLAYSVIGDTVNTGKRVETLTKEIPNGILISDSVYQRCSHLVEVKAWPLVEVKGKRDKIQVYQVLGRKG